MGGQQGAEEVLARRVGPADQVQPFVERAHQVGQLAQEVGARGGAALGLHAHDQAAAELAQPQRAFGCAFARRQHDGLAPDLREEAAQEVGHRHLGQLLLQLQRVALLQAQVGLAALDHRRSVAGRPQRALGLFGDEGFEVVQLGRVDVHAVEIAVGDVLHQVAHMDQEGAAGVFAEVVEGAGQRGHAVDELAHRVAARREEGLVAQRHAQHGQLQPRDEARHLWRHLGVGKDLVEQAGDDVDDHVVQPAAGGLAQLVAVHMDQVGRLRQLGPGAAGLAAERVQADAAGRAEAVMAGLVGGRGLREAAQ